MRSKCFEWDGTRPTIIFQYENEYKGFKGKSVRTATRSMRGMRSMKGTRGMKGSRGMRGIIDVYLLSFFFIYNLMIRQLFLIF